MYHTFENYQTTMKNASMVLSDPLKKGKAMSKCEGCYRTASDRSCCNYSPIYADTFVSIIQFEHPAKNGVFITAPIYVADPEKEYEDESLSSVLLTYISDGEFTVRDSSLDKGMARYKEVDKAYREVTEAFGTADPDELVKKVSEHLSGYDYEVLDENI